MHFETLDIAGAALVSLEERIDDRGFFARMWCEEEFGRNGLTARVVQINTSYNRHMGTLRGMHYQAQPFEEAKTVRCISGRIFDVIVDVRPDSPTYTNWFGAELTAENRQMLVVPEGCAHGYLTLEPETEVLYLVSEFYSPQSERGFRWDDATFGIKWPIDPIRMSDKDRRWPDYQPEYATAERGNGHDPD